MVLIHCGESFKICEFISDTASIYITNFNIWISSDISIRISGDVNNWISCDNIIWLSGGITQINYDVVTTLVRSAFFDL